MKTTDFDTNAREVLDQIRAIAMADVTGVLTVRDGALTIRATAELSAEQRAAIASIEKGTGGLKVKFYDKLKALELLGKCLGLFDRPALPDAGENDLLQAIDRSTREVIHTYDLPEVQQAAAAGNDLVEQAGP